MLFENYLNQYKTDIRIESKSKTGTRKAASKSKPADIRNTASDETKDISKSISPKNSWIFEILTICLGTICFITFVEMYLYLRPELPPVSLPISMPTPVSKSTLTTTTTTTTTTAVTTTPEPLVEDYFTSIVKMNRLAHLEQAMIVEMNDVMKKFSTTKIDSGSSKTRWHHALSKIKSYLRDYDSSIQPVLSETADVGKAVVSHPLVSYRTLRRVVLNLPDVLQYNVDGRLENLANITALIQPPVSVDDVLGAMEGILRLQRTFSISPYDFAHGRFRNYETKSGLTGSDCFLIANLALNENQQPSTAILWFVQALRMYLRTDANESDEIVPVHMVRSSLRNAIEGHNIEVVNENLWTFGKAIETNLSEMTQENEKELVDTLPSSSISEPPYQLYTEGYTFQDPLNFKGLCGGAKLRNDMMTKNLKCYYKTDNPFLAIKPLKVEVHSYDPLIMQFYDILPDKIINHFINTTYQDLYEVNISNQTKFMVRHKQRIASNYRVNDTSDELLTRVPKIIHEATGLNLIPRTSSESAQVFIYGAIGGYYGEHYDPVYVGRHHVKKPENDAAMSQGDRIVTIVFYLTDVKLGGGTAFPKIGLLAEPVKGSAIFFYNLKKNGELHEHTLHGGCPVLLGEKWIVNKWVRSGDQMFLRKCSLNSNE